MNITVECIGTIAVENGRETYAKVIEDNKDPLVYEDMVAELYSQYYYAGNRQNGLFFLAITALPDPFDHSKAIAIVHERYDA